MLLNSGPDEESYMAWGVHRKLFQNDNNGALSVGFNFK